MSQLDQLSSTTISHLKVVSDAGNPNLPRISLFAIPNLLKLWAVSLSSYQLTFLRE
jgi:hypothetical protein